MNYKLSAREARRLIELKLSHHFGLTPRGGCR